MNIIAYDLGTGGIKAALYEAGGRQLAKSFVAYETLYPAPARHEQRPEDWWRGVCESTRLLLAQSGAKPESIAALALSGHSQVAAPIGGDGAPLLAGVPIWSDTRAEAEAAAFFQQVKYDAWYEATGDGDPPACYSGFKMMWLQQHHPEMYAKTRVFLGSKDYVNYRLTGEIATDPSYAVGTGLFDAHTLAYRPDFLQASGIDAHRLPPVIDAHAIVGRVTAQAARESGLAEGTLVACGGVDNSCMALGALGVEEGRAYISLGSSGWIAVNCKAPVTDRALLPFSMPHIQRGLYTSAMSVFAAGSAYDWARHELCRDIANAPDAFLQMNAWAGAAPIGSRGVLFNPSLAGGSAQEPSARIRGGFMGLRLATSREDMLRAILEGVAINLRLYTDELAKKTTFSDDILLCGGGSKSPLWRRIFADVFGKNILKTSVDQDAAALGAAAIAAVAAGLWPDYARIPSLHEAQSVERPDPASAAAYEKITQDFANARRHLAQFEDERS